MDSKWQEFFLQKKIQHWKTNRTIRIMQYLIFAILLYAILFGQVIPKTYELNLNTFSTVRLESPVQIENQAATEKLRREAEEKIEPQYTKDNDILDAQLKLMEDFYQQITVINQKTELSIEERLGEIKKVIYLEQLTDETYKQLLALNSEQLDQLKSITRSSLIVVMNDGIKEADNGIQIAYDNIKRYIDAFAPNNKQLAIDITKSFVRANLLYDPELTKKLKEEARNQVKPIMINKHDVLVDKGELITKEVYDKLAAVGYLKQSRGYNVYFGLLLLVISLTFLFYIIISWIKPTIHKNNLQLMMFFLIILLDLFSIKISALLLGEGSQGIRLFAPISFAVILLTLFLGKRLALATSFLFSIIISLMYKSDPIYLFDYRYGFVFLLGSITIILMLEKVQRRSLIFRSGFWGTLVSMLTISFIYALTTPYESWHDIGFSLLFAGVGGILATILAIGLLPVFENYFEIISPTKLLELSNPNHPLLRKLLIEAPGTYHHSVIVANLAETAAEAIGANGLLCRVGSYYHDIGKAKRPTFFIENQLNTTNPHDKIIPTLSKTIIINHITDGVKMLKEHKIPQAICDFAEQHHGTSILKYFYHKAKQNGESELITVESFRYPGPKAQTKETAIVGIADSVEAAVRSLTSPTPEDIANMVHKIIAERLEDGQFDECDLTLKELKKIEESMLETLNGIFHQRIEYPELKADANELKENNDNSVS